MTGSNQVILDLLPPESAPTGSLEAMAIGSIGKTAFHEMLPTTTILSGRRTVGLRPQPIQLCLTLKTLNAPARLAGCTLGAQRTLGTHGLRSLIFPSRLVRPLLIALQRFPSRASISVAGRIVHKLLRPEIGLWSTAAGMRRFPIGHVGVESSIGAGQKVFGGAILAVRHNGLHRDECILLMLLHQAHQLAVLGGRPAGGALRGDHSPSVIHDPMLLVAQARRGVASSCQLRIRIGRAQKSLIGWTLRGRLRGRIFQFGRLLLIGLPQRGDQLRRPLHEGFIGGVGRDQAAVARTFRLTEEEVKR